MNLIAVVRVRRQPQEYGIGCSVKSGKPAYNADQGPVPVFSGRHAARSEFRVGARDDGPASSRQPLIK